MRVAALISGGVDSAVAVHRLVEQGHQVHLFYIRIGMDRAAGGNCAAEEDMEMCRAIARRYALPLEEVSLQQEYWDSVMAYTLEQVRQGLTPNPDMMCNRMVKFGYFERRWGCQFDRTATGHYATVVASPAGGRIYLGTSPDPVKDQTDFLAQITYEQLGHLMFPVGDLPKERVRAIALEQRLPNARRRDSQGICFLGKINYNDFLRDHLGERQGPVIEIETGRVVGRHRGYWFHTIGQRKGLGLSGGPWYVVGKRVADNVVYVSRGYDTERQYGRRLPLEHMHWISGDPWEGLPEKAPREVAFKNRHTPLFTPATLTPEPAQGCYTLLSRDKIQGIAPGQFAVIYTPDCRLCLGSGVISASKPKTIQKDTDHEQR